MKRVVFASGKGGTGKTTITALVAHVAAVDGPIVLADCDVEAANLPIALDARVITTAPFAGGQKAVVDPALCRGCGACSLVCRFDAMRMNGDAFRSRTYLVDEWACEGCGACARVCSDGAIRMETTQAGEVLTATTTVGPLAFGRLAPGEDLSGKLVTVVRGRADAMAEESGAGVILIDGPPGVGCPATAAVANADLLVAVTEPTVSGEHDLMRLVILARRLGIPVAVVLNKADLSEAGAAHLRERIAAEGIELIAEVPFDSAAVSALLGANGLDLAGDGAWARAVRGVWTAVRLRLG